jgi:WD40 repeat protein
MDRALATAGNDQSVRLWNISDVTTEAVLNLHTDNTSGCAFSPDGTLLAAAGSDYSVQLWDVANRSPQRTLSGHSRRVKGFAFSPDGTLLATAGNDGTVRLWEVPSGRCHCALRVDGPVGALDWHPHGTMLCTVGGVGIYLLSYQP